MSAADKIIEIAKNEIGYLEKASNSNLYSKTGNAGYNNYTKYGYEMHKIYPATMDFPAAWCDTFVDWCFVTAFGEEIAKKLLHGFDDYTVASADKYKAHGEWHKSPVKGDQIFFKDGDGICHTGIVTNADSSKVYTIEGNTSAGASVIANGGGVYSKSYSLNNPRIAGYGRPNYDMVEEDLTMTQYEELKAEIAAKETEIAMLKAQVQKLENPMIYNYIDNNMPAWAHEAVQWCVDTGIVRGTSKGLSLDDKDLKLCQMIYRLHQI